MKKPVRTYRMSVDFRPLGYEELTRFLKFPEPVNGIDDEALLREESHHFGESFRAYAYGRQLTGRRSAEDIKADLRGKPLALSGEIIIRGKDAISMRRSRSSRLTGMSTRIGNAIADGLDSELLTLTIHRETLRSTGEKIARINAVFRSATLAGKQIFDAACRRDVEMAFERENGLMECRKIAFIDPDMPGKEESFTLPKVKSDSIDIPWSVLESESVAIRPSEGPVENTDSLPIEGSDQAPKKKNEDEAETVDTPTGMDEAPHEDVVRQDRQQDIHPPVVEIDSTPTLMAGPCPKPKKPWWKIW